MSKATAINASGVVVGTDSGAGFIWIPDQPNGTVGLSKMLPIEILEVGSHPAHSVTPQAVNAAGVVAGICSTVDVFNAPVTRAFSFTPSDSFLVDLGTFNIHAGTGHFLGNSGAQGINDFGDIVGWADDSNGISHAFLKGHASASGQLIDLDILGSHEPPSNARGINNDGIIIGSATFSDPTGAKVQQAFRSNIGSFTSLGTLLPDPSGLFFGKSSANAVSRGGTIVGSSDSHQPALMLGVIFSQPNAPLGSLPGEALAISSGQAVEKIVGYFFPNLPNPATSGFIYDSNKGMLDLNTQLATPEWHIDSATGINDFGQICGVGTHSKLSGPRAVLLTPMTDS